jgi:hypothetical protein
LNKSKNSSAANDSFYEELIKSSNVAAPQDARDLINAFARRNQSKKFDGNKIRMELIPPSAYIGIGRVLTHGAEKYGANTWQDVEWERYVGALLRHLVAFLEDPTGVDADSGLLHSEHLLVNAVFLNDCVAAGRIPPNERP